ncbi:MAG: AMP-binding protein [Verrucomicrobia bacterium]|nr:AMP-binding protein [Verrucomicrobiota bacterium]
MIQRQLLHFGEIVAMNAYLFPGKIGARDLTRSLTFRRWNDRSCKLANALVRLGLQKGDRIAVLAYNCLEWMEIYAAVAKAGLVVVPVNFRLIGSEARYIVENSEAKAIIIQDDLLDRIETIRAERLISGDKYIHFGGRTPPGYRSYEDLLAMGAWSEPSIETGPNDPFALLYTSGTTGKPKGAIRTSGSLVLLAYLAQVDWGFSRNDLGLLVMPMCHANSLFFAHIFAACGAASCIYDRKSFEPEHLLRTLASHKFTFTSLVPTHYIMMLGLPESVKRKLNVESVTKLLISSAPARQDTKLALMEYFRRSQLYEAYGSTEAGWVTLLRPEDQLTKLGSIGRECLGSGRIKLLDAGGNEVIDGGVGELYSRTPYAFQGYWKLPDKTAEAFRGAYCTVGDMAWRDEDGYYYLADRKSNMIISGGENVYPSEVEQVLGAHPKVKDVAAIGVPHEKWGEAVHVVVVLHQDQRATECDILGWCKNRIAGYKRPRSISFIAEDEMPRTATGKVLHRVLRSRYANHEARSAGGGAS